MIIKMYLIKLLILKNLRNMFKIFNEPFSTENEAIVALEEFEALFIMRKNSNYKIFNNLSSKVKIYYDIWHAK